MRGAGDIRDTSFWRHGLVAAIALLQPGIDPIFLVLLSHHSGLAPADHGLIVGASQTGMAVGALLFAAIPRLRGHSCRWAAVGATLAGLATVTVTGLAALVVVRALFGLCNGLLYASALSSATRRDPAQAMGIVLLTQLVLATIVALALPQIATHAGSGPALALLAGLSLAAAALACRDRCDSAASAPHPGGAAARDTGAAAAVFLFVAGSMMVWSYAGASAVVAGLSEATVGAAVALGSIAGGGASLLVALGARRGWRALPLVPAGSLAALAMLAPFAVPAGAVGFIAGMVIFNLGATYAVARFSAHAIATTPNSARIVPAVQTSAMVVGPLAAALAVHGGGVAALAGAAAAALGLAVLALAIDGRGLRDGRLAKDPVPQANCQAALDEALTQP
ncbi:MAG: MFS transporter [Alphaproteobacteria bacterium]|nr:MAG: MFS transporter [Alphaproteobacteria bacterium]